MFWDYLKSIGGTWKNLAWEALSVMGLLVALKLFTEPPVWVYWVILSGAGLIAPYWAYRGVAKERDALKAGQPLRAQLQRLVDECDKYRSRGVGQYDAAAIAEGALRLCSRFPHDPRLEKLRAIKFPSENPHFTPDVFVSETQCDLGRILAELDKPPAPAPPTDRERLNAGMSLLNDAAQAIYKDVIAPNCPPEMARKYIEWAYKLASTVVLPGSHLDGLRFHRFSPWDHTLEKEGGRACEIYAHNLSNVANLLALPPKDGKPPFSMPYLDPDFVPKPSLTWRDY